MNTDLVVLTFGYPAGADDMLKTVRQLEVEDFIEVVDAVVVTKDAKNKIEIRQPLEVGPGKGAAFGAVTGAVVGLLGGPAGAAVGLVAGGVTGGATAAAFEAGLPTKEIKALAVQELAPEESALLLYLEEVWLDQIERAAHDLAKSIEHHVIAEERKTAREKAAEMRKEKIDATYKAWQSHLDGLRAAVVAARQRLAASMKSDRAAARQQLAATQAQLTGAYKAMLDALRARHQQAQAEISDLDMRARQTTGEAKADLERRRAAANQARQAARDHARETLATRLNGAKGDLEALSAQAARVPTEAKQKMDAHVATLHAQWVAQEKVLVGLDQANDAAWAEMVKSIDAAMDKYEAEMRKAEDEADQAAK